MKKFIFLLLLIAAFSCGKKQTVNQAPQKKSPDFTGKYKVVMKFDTAGMGEDAAFAIGMMTSVEVMMDFTIKDTIAHTAGFAGFSETIKYDYVIEGDSIKMNNEKQDKFLIIPDGKTRTLRKSDLDLILTPIE